MENVSFPFLSVITFVPLVGALLSCSSTGRPPAYEMGSLIFMTVDLQSALCVPLF